MSRAYLIPAPSLPTVRLNLGIYMPNARNARSARNAVTRSTARTTTGGTATLVARGVTKYQGVQTVLEAVGLSVGVETRLGVLGPNGV